MITSSFSFHSMPHYLLLFFLSLIPFIFWTFRTFLFVFIFVFSCLIFHVLLSLLRNVEFYSLRIWKDILALIWVIYSIFSCIIHDGKACDKPNFYFFFNSQDKKKIPLKLRFSKQCFRWEIPLSWIKRCKMQSDLISKKLDIHSQLKNFENAFSKEK